MAWAALLLVSLLPLASAAEWDYSTNWTADYAGCGGQYQSPINLDSDTALPADFSSLSFNMGYRILQTGSLENNGHTLKFTVDESSMMNQNGASIKGGPLNDRYILSQFHLHWGSETGQGSEHTVDGHSYDGELHLVHYKSTFDDLAAAAASGESDALAVVAIFLDEGTSWDQHRGAQEYESIQKLKMAANKLSTPWRGPQPHVVEMEIVLEQLMGSITDLTGMYHYMGSLTTPGCNELVMWLVMATPMHIRGHGLMDALRKNLDNVGEPIQDNYRPTQELNNRTVYHYSGAGSPASYVIVPNAVFNNTNKGNGTYYQCDRILTAEECHSAGQQLTNNASIFFDTENEGDQPSGCNLYWQYGLWYNYNTTADDYEYRYRNQPICYENPAQPNYHGFDLIQNDNIDCEVISKSDCQDVADKLGVTLSDYDDVGYAPGCWWEDGDLYYNNFISNSTGTCYYYNICVCEKP